MSSNIEHIYHTLDGSETNEIKRSELVSYLKVCSELIKNVVVKRRETAYEMAGLLSTSYVHSLETNDIIAEILGFAGELEITDENDATKWAEICILIDRL